MKAVVCNSFDGPAALGVEQVEEPTPKKGEVLVEVAASGLNFPDILITQGKYQFKPPLPFTPGGEGAGIVTQIGEGVDGIAIGDPVIFSCLTGAFAEKVTVDQSMISAVPEGVSLAVAAGVTITYGTTYHAFKQRAALEPGERVLVLGAAGGVGLAAVELAKAMGASVIAAASSAEKLETCKAHGADHGINYSVENLKDRVKEITGGAGVDVVYDPVGGQYTEPAVRSLSPGGRLLVIGFAAGEIPKIPLNLCLLKQGAIVGVFWGSWAAANPADQRQNMADVFELIAAGKIRPLVDNSFSLDDVHAAYAMLMERRARGKVLLVPQ